MRGDDDACAHPRTLTGHACLQGKVSGSAIKVAALTNIHNFRNTQSGTVGTYEDTASVL